MTFSISSVAGMVIIFGGIVVGNLGSSNMIATGKEDTSLEPDMFLAGKALDGSTDDGWAGQVAAIKQYREPHPYGSFILMLRLGQVLTVVGLLVVVIGGFW